MDPWVMIVLWSVFIVITIIVELETADLITIWFTIGAIGALVAASVGVDPLPQVGIFLVVSILLLIATRPLTKKMMQKDIIRTNADRVIGMIGVVTKEVTQNDIGEVKVDNSLWRATTLSDTSFAVGEKVSVDAISGIKVIISKINNDDFVKM